MRGYRNNNPCNIRCSAEKWDGEIQPSQDKEFKQFESMAYGFRATFKLLHNYNKKYSCRTLIDMIHRFAPESENHTRQYIDFVSKKSFVVPNSNLDTRCKIMIDIVTAMAHYENGKPPKESDVMAGWNLFLNIS